MEHDLLMVKLGTTTRKKIKDMKNDLKQKESEKLAQRYSIGANSMSKIEAAHFTNMITFGYNTASIATVLIAYLMLKKLFEIIKKTKHIEKG